MESRYEILAPYADESFKAFHSKLIPNINPDTIIGIRAPIMRKIAKAEFAKGNFEMFFESLPHKYYDENILHISLINEIKDFDTCIAEIEKFLPFVDNWAVCDGLSPKVLKKHRPELLEHIMLWLKSEHTYTLRFGIKMLMDHFLDEDFSPSYPALVAKVKHEDYYVKMMQAWYFATALAKQYEIILPFIEDHRLEPWVHNKTIQKAVESYRITPEQKEYLKGRKVK